MRTDKTKMIEETVIPEMIAYKSIMRIRDIQLRKALELKKAKEKAERLGEPLVEEEKEEGDPLNMTEEELMKQKLENDGTMTLTEITK